MHVVLCLCDMTYKSPHDLPFSVCVCKSGSSRASASRMKNDFSNDQKYNNVSR